VTLGTTYCEPGPFGARNGTVTEFERPTKITFRQPMTMKLEGSVASLVKEPFAFFEFIPLEGLDLDLVDRMLIAAKGRSRQRHG
jgi:hypothetical protein